MKLSAKLITALAAFVLLAVGLVGITSRSAEATHGPTHTDAKVYVANEWSTLTNDPTPISSAYKYAGAGKTIYTTFVEKTLSPVTVDGTIAGTGVSGADVLAVFVEDKDQDTLVTKTAPVTWTAGDTAGSSQIFALTNAQTPIVDATTPAGILDDIAISGTSSTLISLAAAYGGVKDTAVGTITLVRNSTAGSASAVTLTWQTSIVDSVIVTVTTTQDSVGKTITATETGASSGIFKGTIQLVDFNVTPSPGAGSGPGGMEAIGIQSGSTVKVEYADATPVVGTTTKKVSSTATAETAPPLVTVTSPTHGGATQIRRPVFAGSVTDTTAGLDVSEVYVYIDLSDDAVGTGTIVDAGKGSTTGQNPPALPSGTADGTTSTTFTFTPSADLPLPDGSLGTTPVDHIVDWQVQATDLAGNIGWSDSSSTTANVSTTGGAGVGKEGRGQTQTIKIDQKLPGIDEAYTGLALDNTVSPAVRKANVKTSIEVKFNDNLDPASVSNTDFEVVIGGVTQVPSAAAVGGVNTGGIDFRNRVFLTLGADMDTDAVPTVKVVNQISDAAGNTTSTSSKVGKDAMAPTITAATSGGSATTNPTGLTKNAMTITITSDENLSGDPIVTIYDESYDPSADGDSIGLDDLAEGTVIAVNQGSNTWIAAFAGAGFDGTTADGKKKSVVVTANDAAATVSQAGDTLDGHTDVPSTVTIGQATKGKTDDAATGAIKFILDKLAPTLTLSPTGDTSDNSPVVQWAFGEKVTVGEAKFGVSTATLTDVTSELSTSDSKTYFRAVSGLTETTYKATATATDLAGNKATGLSGTFTVKARAKFTLTLVPGTTLVSLPLNPGDGDINSVFSPAGIVSVSAYDTASGSFLSSVRDATSGDLVGDISTIVAGTGYIVVVDQPSSLSVVIPPLGPSTIPPSVPLAVGWNLVGATDVVGGSGGALQAAGSTVASANAYFPSKVTQAYSWSSTSKVWSSLNLAAGGDNVTVGSAYWAYSTAVDVIVP